MQTTLRVGNSLGLHARSAAKVAKLVAGFDCRVVLIKGGQQADASSVLDLLTLGAPKGSSLKAEAEGPQAAEVLAALEELFDTLFGEGA